MPIVETTPRIAPKITFLTIRGYLSYTVTVTATVRD